MASIRGPKFKTIALLLAALCLAAGVYLTFFRSRGFVKNTAVIVSVEVNIGTGDESDTYTPTVEHTVDGKTYTGRLNESSSSYGKVGKTIKIYYDPDDPTVVHGSKGGGIYLMAVSAAILIFTAAASIAEKKSQRQVRELREQSGRTGYAPSVQGEERELYFLTDLGTPKYGHRIEDRQRRVLYEAKMTKFTALTPFGFDFIDYEHGTSTPHLVGHEEESQWDSLIIDNHYTFELDGVDVFRHLKENGVSVDTSLGGGSGKIIGMNYRIFRNGMEIARAETTSRYAHEDDAERHRVAAAIPAPGFYRVWTRERNLDLLFVTLMAFARTGAMDDDGGTFGALTGTLEMLKKG